MSTSILLFGSASDQENSGDLAMLQRSVERLQGLLPGSQVILWCESLDAVRNLKGFEPQRFPNLLGSAPASGPGVSGVGRFRRLAYRASLFIRAADLLVSSAISRVIRRTVGLTAGTRKAIGTLRNVDLVVTYGSGALNDLWLRQNVVRWSLVYLSAHLLGKPVALTGQGIGPLRSRFGRFVLARALNTTDLITLRDAGESVDLLRDLKVDRPLVMFTGDDALEQPKIQPGQLEQILRDEGVSPDRLKIAVHIRPTDYQNDLELTYPKIAVALDQLVEVHDAQVIFVPMSSKKTIDDRAASLKVMERMARRDRCMVLSGKYSPSELKAVIGHHELAIGVSYHFALFALGSGVPTVTLYSNDYYRQKGAGLTASFGEGITPVNLLDAPVDDLVGAANLLLSQRESLQESLVARTRAMEQRVQEAERYLKQLADRDNNGSLNKRRELSAGVD